MITTNEKLSDFTTFSETLDYHPDASLFFDIETTGFSPDSSVVFLIGMLRREQDGWMLTQLLAEQPEEELPVLQVFLDTVTQYDTLVHFNGSTFDLPYITKKAARYGLAHTLDSCRSLDLYRKFRPFGKLFGMERMNQISLEKFLGWERSDKLTGKHMVSLFGKYASSGEPGIRDLLLLHNHDDMLGMTKLLQMAAYQMLFDGIYAEIIAAELQAASHPMDSENPLSLKLTFSLEAPLPKPLRIHPACHQATDENLPSHQTSANNSSAEYWAAEGSYEAHPVSASKNSQVCSLSAEDCTAVLSVPLYEGTLRHFFADYKNYYFLPLEDQAIHKSVAGYVDKAYRTPARASNCYIKKSGRFLPQPEEIFTPAFKYEHNSAQLYFEYSDDLTADNEKIGRYITALLRSVTVHSVPVTFVNPLKICFANGFTHP